VSYRIFTTSCRSGFQMQPDCLGCEPEFSLNQLNLSVAS